MANLGRAKAMEVFKDEIATVMIENNVVDNVLDKAIEANLVSLSIMNENVSKDERAKHFISAVLTKIREDPSLFESLLQVFESVQQMKYLGRKLKKQAESGRYMSNGAGALNNLPCSPQQSSGLDSGAGVSGSWPRSPRRKRHTQKKSSNSPGKKCHGSGSDVPKLELADESGFSENSISATPSVSSTPAHKPSQHDGIPQLSPTENLQFDPVKLFTGTEDISAYDLQSPVSAEQQEGVNETESNYMEALRRQGTSASIGASNFGSLQPSKRSELDENEVIEDLQRELSMERESAEHLQSNLEKLKHEKKLTEHKLKQTETESNKAKAKMEKEIECLEKEVELYQTKFAEKEKENEKLKNQIKCYETKIKELQQQATQSKIHENQREYEEKIKELNKKMRSSQADASKAHIELTNMRAKLSETESQYKDQIIKYEQEKSELRQKLHKMELNEKKVIAELAKAREEAANLKHKKAEEIAKQAEQKEKLVLAEREVKLKELEQQYKSRLAQLQDKLKQFTMTDTTAHSSQ